MGALKRQKVEKEGHGSSDKSTETSLAPARQLQGRHVLEPFLAMGIISNDVPMVLQVRHGGKDADRPDVNIVTSLGDCWSIWTAENLVQVFVGTQLPAPISQLALSTSPDSILASAASKIYRFVRGRVTAVYEMPSDAIVSRFLVVGDSLLALTQPPLDDSSSSSSLSSSSSSTSPSAAALHHFSLATGELSDSIELPLDASPTAFVHPSTYLHKVLIGYSNGTLQLWNFRTRTLVHQFDATELRGKHGIAPQDNSSAILSLTQSPALDVIAIVTSDNRILIHDVRQDVAVMTFTLEAQLSATPPTFRTDGRAHTMAAASRTGDIFVFDLEPTGKATAPKAARDSDEEADSDEDGTPARKTNAPRLIHTIRNAHSESISGLEFVAGQPLLISSSADNSIKEWFFEPASDPAPGSAPSSSTSASSSLPRLLKSRSGHSEPPSIVRWFGEDGRAPLLTAGRDRSVRLGWVGREARGGELSQGSIVRKANQLSLPPQALKLEPATSLSFSLTRSRDWDDILTIHPASQPRTWLGKDRRMKAAPLMLADKKKQQQVVGGDVTTGFVSHCGNFALTGSVNGLVAMWNMQSGRYVRSFDTRPIVASFGLDKKTGKPKETRGKGSKVVGIVADEGNKELVVVTADGSVFVFDFITTQLLSSQTFHPLAGLRPSPHATLLALIPVGISKPLLLLDMQTRRVVRRFSDLRGRITDVTFSPTLRSLVVATMDGALSTYDVPSGQMIDRMFLREVIVSLDWSPDGSMVAGCGTEGKGVYLWSWTSARGHISNQEYDEVGDSIEESAAMMPSVRGPSEDEEHAADQATSALDVLHLNGSSTAYYNPSQKPLLLRDEQESRPMVTLTSQPRTKWNTLLNLDVIKARDKPQQTAQKPSKTSAPFFLGAAAVAPSSAVGAVNGNSIAELAKGKAATAGANGSTDHQRQTLLEQMTRSDLLYAEKSKTEQLLDLWQQHRGSTGDIGGRHIAEQDDTSHTLFDKHLLELSPPQLDLTLRLELTNRSSMALLLEACAERLRQGRDFEGLTAIVETLRRVRAEDMLPSVAENDQDGVDGDVAALADEEQDELRELRKAWSTWLRALNEANDRVGKLLDFNLGTLSFLRGVPVI